MAKNYSFSEVCEIIHKGEDVEAIAEIGKRFPILACKVAKVAAKAGDDFVELMGFMPEYLTANKVYNVVKDGISSGSDDAEEVEETEAETTATKTEKGGKKESKASEATVGTDYDSMSGKELWDLLGKLGKRKDCKEKMGGCKKEHMAEYMKKYGGAAEETEAEEAEEATEEAAGKYDGMTAMELFKECKKRGIKTEPKQRAEAYVKLLEADDAEKSDDTNDDDWGDDEAEEKEEKSTKKSGGKANDKKAGGKAKKEEADDDDDWEI